MHDHHQFKHGITCRNRVRRYSSSSIVTHPRRSKVGPANGTKQRARVRVIVGVGCCTPLLYGDVIMLACAEGIRYRLLGSHSRGFWTRLVYLRMRTTCSALTLTMRW